MTDAERDKAVRAAVEAELGARIICHRCSATIATYDARCQAELDDPCPGFSVVDEARERHFRNIKPARKRPRLETK